jgi:hypothetical protein
VKEKKQWALRHVSAIMQINLCQPLSTIAAHMITSNTCFTHSYLSEPSKTIKIKKKGDVNKSKMNKEIQIKRVKKKCDNKEGEKS